MPSAAWIGSRSGLLALLCGIGSLVAISSGHFGGFFPLAYAAVLFGLVGFVFGLWSRAASGVSGAIGLVAAIVGIALPVLFLIALIVAFSRFE
jgi:hypothetical protein